MITVHCQASTKGNWERGEMTAFMDSFLRDHLLEVRHAFTYSKYFNMPAVDVIQDLYTPSSSNLNTLDTITK